MSHVWHLTFNFFHWFKTHSNIFYSFLVFLVLFLVFFRVCLPLGGRHVLQQQLALLALGQGEIPSHRVPFNSILKQNSSNSTLVNIITLPFNMSKSLKSLKSIEIILFYFEKNNRIVFSLKGFECLEGRIAGRCSSHTRKLSPEPWCL